MTELAASKLITIARLAIALATVCLLLGIVLPSITFEAVGDSTRFLQLAVGLPLHTTYSLLGGILKLAASQPLLGLFLFSFTVIFPLAKLAILSLWATQLRARKRHNSDSVTYHPEPIYRTWVDKLGKWSMLDVFVLSVLVLLYQSFTGARATIGTGIYLFAVAVTLSLFIPSLLRRAERAEP